MSGVILERNIRACIYIISYWFVFVKFVKNLLEMINNLTQGFRCDIIILDFGAGLSCVYESTPDRMSGVLENKNNGEK